MPNNNKTHRGTTYYKPPPIQIRRIPDKTNSPILSQYLNVVVPLAVNKKNIHRSNHVNKNKLIRFPACFSLPKRRPFPGKNSPPSQTICHFKPLFSSSPKTSSESPFILPHPVHADGALTFLETSNPPRRVAQPLWHNLSNCQKSEYAPLSKPKKKQRVLFLLYLALSLFRTFRFDSDSGSFYSSAFFDSQSVSTICLPFSVFSSNACSP